ncbi:beta-1,6-N-acetylglucosaminyltransferase [Pedobacter deserti]|uniref:beta-1,6-N-acetylglucosaminyltransferase n=1 Tax=Pedobacter deserti TaxID=2817382 RepID=UPI0021092E37|nr:beta-1,6-N-acetylglucosaminyltransferase [Pedobacter sp. SYSU D00382]
MKHAFLILAHEQPKHLLKLVNKLNSDFANFYIHIDSKSKVLIESDEIQLLKAYSNVTFVTSRSTHWGGFSLVKAEIDLLKAAYDSCDNERFHLISGVDYPMVSNQHLYSFFENNVNDYILWDESEAHKRYYIDCFYFYDRYFGKSKANKFNYYFLKPIYVAMQRASRLLYQYLNIKLRKQIPGTFYHAFGAQWFSISRSSAEYIVNYLRQNEWIIKRFEHTAVSDETFFVMILMNGPRKEYAINDNLRFFGKKSNELLLDTSDWVDLERSNGIFARKVNSGKSDLLISLIDERTA